MVGSLERFMLVVAGRVAFLIQRCVADVTFWYIEYIVHYLKYWNFSLVGFCLGLKKRGGGNNPFVYYRCFRVGCQFQLVYE